MPMLRVCDIGLSDDASRAFHSMLRIIEGRAAASWRTSDIGDADVLLAHADCNPQTLRDWSSRGKPVVLVIDDQANWPAARFVLRHPFRVMPLLTMLNEVAEHFLAVAPLGLSRETAWSAAESLRAIVNGTSGLGWHVAKTRSGARLWIADGQAYASAAAWDQLRAGNNLPGSFQPTSERPDGPLKALPIADLAWFVGLHGAGGLAPWLELSDAYRLRRWPDFGRLGVATDLIELSALCTAQSMTPGALTQRSGLAPDRVRRYLAATSLAGLLTAALREPLELSAAAPRPGGWIRFVSGLRRHLKLVA